MYSSGQLLDLLRTKNEDYWIHQGEKMALDLFHRVAQCVPAYKDFLYKNGIRHSIISTVKDFTNLPLIDKKNYISKYSWDELCWNTKTEEGGVIYSSSGTSGQPTFWVRNARHSREMGVLHSVLFNSLFQIDQYKTLFIDCFAMGIHVAGLITATSVNQTAGESGNVFLATPGSKKEDIIDTVLEVGSFFDQIVFMGYPPFIKDTVEEIGSRGFDWTSVKVGFFLAAQGFSEKWRAYLKKLVGDKDTQVINIYGSADAGAMAFETPLSINIRQRLEAGEMAYDFGLPHMTETIPFLFQFIPTLKFFESVGNELIFTTDNGIPLIRYNIHDLGGVVRYGELVRCPKAKNTFELPFVYLFGRANHSVIFYGANIYPEHILTVLEHNSLVGQVSGRFNMETKDGESQEQKLYLRIELGAGVRKSEGLDCQIFHIVTEQLSKINKEFLVVFKEMGNEKNVVINLYEYGSDQFVPKEMKNRYLL